MNSDDAATILYTDHQPPAENPDDRAYWLLQLIAAVDFLRRGDRHALTVWDALEEALTWWTAEQRTAAEPVTPEAGEAAGVAGDGDPRPDALTEFTRTVARLGVDADDAAQQAVRRWVGTIGVLYNDGHSWPHAVARAAGR